MSTARRGAGAGRLHMRRGPASGPAPLHGAPDAGAAATASPPEPADFLRERLRHQVRAVERHHLGEQRVWIKKAGARHGTLRYRLLAAIAALLRLDVLTPVPNPGGPAAIAIEARRLRELAAAGLRVPTVLAEQPEGLLMTDLGEGGRPPVILHDRLDHAAASGPAALLAVWREGLDAIATVHARGTYLSQAFDRNLLHCPDGCVGYIDFEDDPGQTLGLDECQVRDWLSYLHSTAVRVEAASPQAAGELWHAALAQARPAVRERLAQAARRMRWLRHLPDSRRWGRDTQRVRAAAGLLARWHAEVAAGR